MKHVIYGAILSAASGVWGEALAEIKFDAF